MVVVGIILFTGGVGDEETLAESEVGMMAKDLGMDAVTSPNPTSRYRGVGAKLRFLLREVYFCHYYWMVGE